MNTEYLQKIERERVKIKGTIDYIQNSRDKLIVWILYETGCTLKELAKMQPAQIDFNKNHILIPNADNQMTRKAPISEELSKAIACLFAELGFYNKLREIENQPIFGKAGKEISTRRIEQIVFKYLNDISPRGLRRLYLAWISAASEELNGISGLKNIKKPFLINKSVLENLEFESLRDSVLILLVLETGCRVSELCDLMRKDVSGDEIVFGKKVSAQKVKISQKLAGLLQKYITERNGSDADDYLFPGNDHITARRVQQVFSHYSKKISQRITPNLLRKAYVSSRFISGEDPMDISASIGVKKISSFNYGFSARWGK